MVVKNSFLLVFVIFFYSLSEAKKEIVLKDDPELTNLEEETPCITETPKLLPVEDSIQYLDSKIDPKKKQKVKTKYLPYFKLYDNEALKGPAKAEVNKEGFFINGEQKCNWTSKYTKCSETSPDFFGCDLVKAEKVNPRIGEKPCEFIKNYWGKFKIEEITDTYYTMKIADKKYYVSRKETPQYEYIESRDKKVEGLKKKLLAKINKNFKKHQNDFLEFVEKTKTCHKGENKNCLPRINRDYLKYICYDKKIKCESKWVPDWLDTQEAYEVYYHSFAECFDFSKMQIEISDYKGGDEFDIFTILNGYDRNITCSYSIKLNESTKDEIKVEFKNRIEMPDEFMPSEEGYEPDQRNDIEFFKQKRVQTAQRRCNRVHGERQFIPSRLHDKNLQKWE